jgi:hypothetical protein
MQPFHIHFYLLRTIRFFGRQSFSASTSPPPPYSTDETLSPSPSHSRARAASHRDNMAVHSLSSTSPAGSRPSLTWSRPWPSPPATIQHRAQRPCENVCSLTFSQLFASHAVAASHASRAFPSCWLNDHTSYSCTLSTGATPGIAVRPFGGKSAVCGS